MSAAEKILGIDGGGTKTAWVVVEREGNDLRILDQGRLPPANLRLTTEEQLRLILSELPKDINRAGVYLAGCATEEDRQRLNRLCIEIWPNAAVTTGSDRDSGVAAALANGDGIVVNAGSGSFVTGRRDGKVEKAGGWGHILGDAGGAYFIVIQALRLILREHDLHRGEVQFASKVLRALSLNNLDELVRWAQTAEKIDIANLAPVVMEAAANGDELVVKILEDAAGCLCEYTEAVATRLHLLAPKVVLIGGLFQRDSTYAHTFRRRLKKNLPDARVTHAERAPELGAAWLAAQMTEGPAVRGEVESSVDVDGLAASLTEQRNPRSEQLEQMSVRELVDLFVNEEQFVQEALRNAADDLARAVEMVGQALRRGGKLFYVGAGSSGRIGVLDASEISPTFGAPAELVQGIIAGGVTALYRSVEGAEDEQSSGAAALDQRGVKAADIVLGITASGRTPFVLAALTRAKSIGAKTIMLTCNPAKSDTSAAELVIELAVGPELLTGSTRLKAGTATKIALNIISTGAMIALGRVRGNLMIDLHASNTKLRDRAVRLVSQLAGVDYETARRQLEAAKWDLRAVLAASGK